MCLRHAPRDDRPFGLLTAFVTPAGTLVAFIVQWRRSRKGDHRDPFDGPGDGGE